ncbi:MAG: acyl carrier protein [Faecalibacillus sp.]
MIFDEVKQLIIDTLSCDEGKVTLEANLKDDLDADSLDAVELIMAAEDQYDIEIPDEDAMNMKTVKDIVDYIEKNKG